MNPNYVLAVAGFLILFQSVVILKYHSRYHQQTQQFFNTIVEQNRTMFNSYIGYTTKGEAPSIQPGLIDRSNSDRLSPSDHENLFQFKSDQDEAMIARGEHPRR